MFHQTFNAIFISDLHIGYGVTNYEMLFKFLKEIKTKKIFLVGDIIHRQCKLDDEKLQEFINILNNKKCETYFITGNHEATKPKLPYSLEDIIFLDNYIYSSIKHKVYIDHGHSYDTKDATLRFLKSIDKRVNIKKRNTKLKIAIKKRIHNTLKFLAKIFLHSSFRKYMVFKAIKNECNVVICGHFHKYDYSQINNTYYYNCGDWINNCTFVAEDLNGNFILKKL